MDIEHLNKTQIVLLTLLVSFVTSIATGIATVSLMEKAPTDVTRIISRVIEQPIETILPGEKEVVTQTVVVQESDLIAQALDLLRPSVVRVHQTERPGAFLSFGVITDAQGTVLTDASVVKEKKQYTLTFDDGTQLQATAGSAVGGQIALTPEVPEGGESRSYTPVAQAALVELKLGQTVVALGNSNGSFSVAPGILSEIVLPSGDGSERGFVRTTITSQNIVPGSPLVNINGQIVGIAQTTETGMFRPLVLQTTATQ